MCILNVFSNGLPGEMNNYHTACTCLSVLLCIFKCLIKLTCQSGCKVTLVALIFIFYAFSNVSSNNMHNKLSLLHISLYMSVELLIFSLTILRFCLHMLSKCLINVKQMVYCIFAGFFSWTSEISTLAIRRRTVFKVVTLCEQSAAFFFPFGHVLEVCF